MEIDVVDLTCAVEGCGVTFWVTRGFNNRRQQDKADIHCPCGHVLAYPGKSDADVLAESRKNTVHAKAEVSRLRNELKRMPCPYCGKRCGSGLKRHIKAKHPGRKLVQRKK